MNRNSLFTYTPEKQVQGNVRILDSYPVPGSTVNQYTAEQVPVNKMVLTEI